jgi:hypothetical protein
MSEQKRYDDNGPAGKGETPPLGESGRDDRGRFTKGNKSGRGNPFARRVAAMRQALMDAVSDEDVAAISKKMVELARGGDVAAARLVLGYVIGKPQPAEDPDRLDEKEWRQYVNDTVKAGEMEAVVGGMSATLACTIAGAAVPGMQAQAAQTLREDLLAEEDDDDFDDEDEDDFDEEDDEFDETPPAGSSREEIAAARVAELLKRIGQMAAEPTRRAANRPDGEEKHPRPAAPPRQPPPKGKRETE